jgi:ribosome biogenesis GTPase / thiamine phosphate phosphatase
LTAAALTRHEPEVGCVLGQEAGVLQVLTDRGEVRATYGARMLGLLARDRSCAPQAGEWVALRRWPDGPVTVESLVWRPPASAEAQAPLAPVLPLRRRAAR